MDCKSVYNILIMIDCKSVATILKNQIVCFEILGDFLVCMQKFNINPLNAKLNPICHLLALLGAHPILHVSRRVKGRLQNNHAKVVLTVNIT